MWDKIALVPGTVCRIVDLPPGAWDCDRDVFVQSHVFWWDAWGAWAVVCYQRTATGGKSGGPIPVQNLRVESPAVREFDHYLMNKEAGGQGA